MPVEITPWLYLSSEKDVLQKLNHLQTELQITHVLSVNAMSPQRTNEIYWELCSLGLEYVNVDGYDVEGYDMMGKHWNTCREVLHSVRENYYNNLQQQDEVDEEESRTKSKVVVHCEAGQNRSGFIVGAALLDLEGWTLVKTVTHLREKRGVLLTNKSFQVQLCQLADQLGRLGSVHGEDEMDMQLK
mmetsp:Transcript_3940/g.5897  ORF Transcript_3940/g.5897 Transcript_3940/m.5897 type:complete len:187 (+) Transcript_3940:282-842(+)